MKSIVNSYFEDKSRPKLLKIEGYDEAPSVLLPFFMKTGSKTREKRFIKSKEQVGILLTTVTTLEMKPCLLTLLDSTEEMSIVEMLTLFSRHFFRSNLLKPRWLRIDHAKLAPDLLKLLRKRKSDLRFLLTVILQR